MITIQDLVFHAFNASDFKISAAFRARTQPQALSRTLTCAQAHIRARTHTHANTHSVRERDAHKQKQ